MKKIDIQFQALGIEMFIILDVILSLSKFCIFKKKNIVSAFLLLPSSFFFFSILSVETSPPSDIQFLRPKNIPKIPFHHVNQRPGPYRYGSLVRDDLSLGPPATVDLLFFEHACLTLFQVASTSLDAMWWALWL
jgi:hypothetical protein